MGKNKLKKFAENEKFEHLIQPSREEVLDHFYLQGKWHQDFFKNDKPIILELGCGKGEYTIGLSQLYPNKNFIGIDLKGARLWRGAKTVAEKNIGNVAFIRTQIELVAHIFASNEISEIWITFPDPQIKFRREKHRLTHPDFIESYRKVLKPQGAIHLKTDSEFLHGYTLGVITSGPYEVDIANHDIYNVSTHDLPSYLYDIQTYYEKQYLKENKKITYIKFHIN